MTIGGIITTVRKSLSKGGQPLFFIGVEDLSGRVELLVFGKTAERVEGLLVEDEMVEISLKDNRRDGAFAWLPRAFAESVNTQSNNMSASLVLMPNSYGHSPRDPTPAALITFDQTAGPSAVSDLSNRFAPSPKETSHQCQNHRFYYSHFICRHPERRILWPLFKSLPGVTSVDIQTLETKA